MCRLRSLAFPLKFMRHCASLKVVDTKIPGLDVDYDEFGFAIEKRNSGVHIAGVTRRPMDVVTTVRDGTGAALKAAQTVTRKVL